jgi:hypothetical protein
VIKSQKLFIIIIYSHRQQMNSQLKWSNGIKYEQSKRRTRQPTESVDYEPEYTNPVARALNEQETWTIDDQGTYFPTIPYTIGESYSNSSSISNKREETYNKMGEREMVAQVGRNPFMDSSHTYAHDVSSDFLMPKNTSQDKVKNLNN